MKMLTFKRWYSIFIYKSLEIHWSLKAYWIQILFNTTSKFHAKKINVSILYAKMLHNFTYLFDNTLNFKFINTYILRGIYFLNDVDRNDNIIQLSNKLFQRIHNSITVQDYCRFHWLKVITSEEQIGPSLPREFRLLSPVRHFAGFIA